MEYTHQRWNDEITMFLWFCNRSSPLLVFRFRKKDLTAEVALRKLLLSVFYSQQVALKRVKCLLSWMEIVIVEEEAVDTRFLIDGWTCLTQVLTITVFLTVMLDKVHHKFAVTLSVARMILAMPPAEKKKNNDNKSFKAIQAVVSIILFTMQQTGKTDGEIDRVTLWKKERELKTGGFDPKMWILFEVTQEKIKSQRQDVLFLFQACTHL
ncbi:hypothetical protein L1987_30082 [Smallanthus sonchifolius]|uniref:Uncharacterized protein n=1 Tax=Smallanthus sonchifolius TaxID=185202 RepID=A0ACB9I2G3_9ASTR|nr:hypothetical protein L1987_30082 [Smallanthus sonchifolius]